MSAPAVTTGLIQALRQERVLLWCVLASIALHALLFLGVFERAAPAPEVKPLSMLTARLAPVATAARAQPSPPQPSLAPPPPKPVPAPRSALTPPVAAPQPGPQGAAAAESAKSAPAEAAPESAAPAGAASSGPPAAPSQTRSAPQGQAGARADATAKSGGEIIGRRWSNTVWP